MKLPPHGHAYFPMQTPEIFLIFVQISVVSPQGVHPPVFLVFSEPKPLNVSSRIPSDAASTLTNVIDVEQSAFFFPNTANASGSVASRVYVCFVALTVTTNVAVAFVESASEIVNVPETVVVFGTNAVFPIAGYLIDVLNV